MAISRNGWDVYSSGSNSKLVNFPWVTGKVRGGDHYVVLDYIAKRWNAEVETIRKDWSWGYANRAVRGATVISEHATGTAVDFNAPLHPLGKKNTFNSAKQSKIRRIMNDVSHAARWGGEWSRPDDMHVELIGGNELIKKVADQIRAGKLPGLSGEVKPVGKPSKPKPAPSKDKSGAWPEKPLKVTDKHTAQSDAAWRELLHAIGYRDKDLGKNLLAWLSDLEDPRTGKGYYDLTKWTNDGVMGPEGVKALQRKLFDTKGDGGKPEHLYFGKADGKRLAKTVNAEINYLNLKANRGVK